MQQAPDGIAPPSKDRATLGLGMALCTMFLGFAIIVNDGSYDPLALFFLTIAAGFCFGAIALRPGPSFENRLDRRFTLILVVIACISTCVLLYLARYDPEIPYSVAIIAALGLLQVTNLRATRIPLLLATVVAFCAIAVMTLKSPQGAKGRDIDVFLFQQSAADALRHGQDPYAARIPNIYNSNDSQAFQNPRRFGPGTPFYGPGVVDQNGWVTYGFPYPPLSLLLVMPSYLLSGDPRFALVIAMALSGLMMAAAQPGRRGALAALLFLINPRGFFVIDHSWTEPLLVFSFSLAMFCACRWRKGLPWALGLFFATKQYAVLGLPVLFMLIEGPNPFKQLLKVIGKAGLVAAAVTLPFFAWNPQEFIRDVVQLQIVQPFRTDALSYLVWIYNATGGHKAPIWTPLLAVIPAIIIGIWRGDRSPAGFAAALTLITLAFFAFNKQAFCNYYYFVIGAACWAIAAMRPGPHAGGPGV
jgi:hypothetical protein